MCADSSRGRRSSSLPKEKKKKSGVMPRKVPRERWRDRGREKEERRERRREKEERRERGR